MKHADAAGTASLAGTWSGPLYVQATDQPDLEKFARERRAWIDSTLVQQGAILFRGFNVDSPDAFRRGAVSLCDRLLDYVYRSTPRRSVDSGIYTATEYRANASIPMHNENAFQRNWPMKLVFGCLQPAASGGETPLASTAGVTQRIDNDIVEAFNEHGVLYVRNYGHGVDLDWETTFQTQARSDVEAYCRTNEIEWEWLSAQQLRTRQQCQALARHPTTGETLWFNQAHLFHISSLEPEHQNAMLEQFGEDDLPRNAYLGDGSSLDGGMLERIRSAYEAEKVTFPWEKGDVLLVDNMLVAHSRNPFEGTRQVLVAMGDPFSGYGADAAGLAP